MISFNVPPYVGSELSYVKEAAEAHKICGDGPFTKKCSKWFEDRFNTPKCLLTTSGTTAIEMAALMCGIERGDEVILPSFTFSSTANAFVLAGAKLVFVDIRPDTLNIDEKLIEAAITPRTKAICVVHYAGVGCEMDAILDIAQKYGLKVVEDAAHAPLATYKGRALGSIGDFGCLSFHETKNYSMGEGGAILINNPQYTEQAEIMREKGTDRSRFMRGQVDKYTWVDYGSSYLPSDMLAAYLWAQLEVADQINNNRLATWNAYYEAFSPLAQEGKLTLPYVPEHCMHNAHMFYVKLRDLEERTAFISYLKDHDVQSVFHYIPLHSAPAGLKFGRFAGTDTFTTRESERLARLPMYYGMTEEERITVIDAVKGFFA
ncbi:MAG: dTDP-4-amino-4,6-dideoxygalactose transaminase [Coriobacteriales bacterium]|nr:dTDP-4-amino-4,6-dideoxygalactose transaminase [Coriobacteriales bacterium]